MALQRDTMTAARGGGNTPGGGGGGGGSGRGGDGGGGGGGGGSGGGGDMRLSCTRKSCVEPLRKPAATVQTYVTL